MSLDLWCQSDSFSIPPPLKTWFVWLLMCRRGLNAFLHLSMSFEPIFVGQFDFKRFRRNTGRATRTETSVTGHLAKHTQKGGGGLTYSEHGLVPTPPPVGNPIQLLREKCVCVCGCHLDFGNVDDISGERKKKKKRVSHTPFFGWGFQRCWQVPRVRFYHSIRRLIQRARNVCVCVISKDVSLSSWSTSSLMFLVLLFGKNPIKWQSSYGRLRDVPKSLDDEGWG